MAPSEKLEIITRIVSLIQLVMVNLEKSETVPELHSVHATEVKGLVMM